MTVRVGLNGHKHPDHIHDLTGAAERLGITASYYDAAEKCVYLDLPEGSVEDWTSPEDVTVTLPDGSQWFCWVELCS